MIEELPAFPWEINKGRFGIIKKLFSYTRLKEIPLAF
jgi:hypothetical protein